MAQDYDARQVRLKTMAHCCSYINKLINEQRTGKIDLATAKGHTYMAQVLMTGIERLNHETKLDQLEAAVLKLETDAGRRNGRRY